MLHIPINVSEKERNLSPHCHAPPPPSKELYHTAANTCLVVWRHTDLITMIPFSLFHKESKCKEKQTNKQRYRYNYFMCNYWKTCGESIKYIAKTLYITFFPSEYFLKIISRNLFDWESESTESKIVAYRILGVLGWDLCDFHQDFSISFARCHAHASSGFCFVVCFWFFVFVCLFFPLLPQPTNLTARKPLKQEASPGRHVQAYLLYQEQVTVVRDRKYLWKKALFHTQPPLQTHCTVPRQRMHLRGTRCSRQP